MKLADNVELLEIKTEQGAYYPVLLWDDTHVILVDTGFPGQFDLLKAQIEKAGFSPEKITHVILTHQDMDHVGSAKLLREMGAKILAYEIEAPYIQGDKTPIKMADMEAHLAELTPDRLAFYNMIKAGAPRFYTRVDECLKDGQIIDVCGGIEVLHTPGHTPGHIALRLRACNIIICGDAATAPGGVLSGPNPMHAHDLAEATRSYEKLLALHAAGYACYHGGYVAG